MDTMIEEVGRNITRSREGRKPREPLASQSARYPEDSSKLHHFDPVHEVDVLANKMSLQEAIFTDPGTGGSPSRAYD